jgi:hypothetical protein
MRIKKTMIGISAFRIKINKVGREATLLWAYEGEWTCCS